jgi:hypothetical protein
MMNTPAASKGRIQGKESLYAKNLSQAMQPLAEEVMKQPVIRFSFERVHWWILLIALLVGVAIFFALHLHAY